MPLAVEKRVKDSSLRDKSVTNEEEQAAKLALNP
jgi:hypothetical protein